MTKFARLRVLSSLTLSVIVMLASVYAHAAQNKELALVGNRVATLIDTPDNPSRASALIKSALKNYDLSITATTQAWSGSGLRNGKYQGYIDHYSLDQLDNNYLYSAPYAVIPLHIASKNIKAINVTRLDKIYRQRLGVENRFANTDELRGERSVSWARAPDFLGNIQQLAGRRVDYIIADIYMLREFNKLLVAVDQEPLYISASPIYEVNMQVGINKAVAGAENVIVDINNGVDALKESGEYSKLYVPSNDTASILDEAKYENILRRW